jgi:uncharacterized protein YceK
MRKVIVIMMMVFPSIVLSGCGNIGARSTVGNGSCGSAIENSTSARGCVQPKLGWKGASGSDYRIGG